MGPLWGPNGQRRSCPTSGYVPRVSNHTTKRLRIAALIAAAALALACGNVPDPDAKPMDKPSGAAPAAAAESKAPAVTYPVPVAADFSLTVKVLEKECFGSAGCNIKYRMVVKQVSAKTFDPSKTYEITYTLKGTDDPEVGTLEVTGDQYSTDEYARTSTPNSKTKVTAVVTEVSER